MTFAFSSTQWNRFTVGGVAAHPTEYTLAAWVKPMSNNALRSICVRSNGSPATAWSHQIRTTTTVFGHYTFDGAVRFVDGTTVYSLNKWYHVAATAKNSGPMRLYVNGIEEGTPISIGTLWTGGNDFWVSAATGGSHLAYIGEIAEFCIWYKELTAQEISTIASKVRFAPLQVQKQHIRLYLPMNDRPNQTPISVNYKDLSSYNNTQTRTNNPVCLADEISYP